MPKHEGENLAAVAQVEFVKISASSTRAVSISLLGAGDNSANDWPLTWKTKSAKIRTQIVSASGSRVALECDDATMKDVEKDSTMV